MAQIWRRKLRRALSMGAIRSRQNPVPNDDLISEIKTASPLAYKPLAATDQLLPASESIFLLDWDDTLCASSYFQKQGGNVALFALDEEMRAECRQLALWVRILLEHVLRLSPSSVYIVTNSQAGWVELSIEHYLPELRTLIPKLNIISARSCYSNESQEMRANSGRLVEEDLIDWKYRAFIDILFQKKHRSASTMVVFGDSLVELKAADRACRDVRLKSCKSIQFVPSPSLRTLCEQVQYVCTILPSLLIHKPSIKIILNPDIFNNIPKHDPFKPE